MEWAVFVVLAILAAVLVGIPRGAARNEADAEALLIEALRAEHAGLLGELRELDEDAEAGRISAADRHAGRLAIAPRLRRLTEDLRARGVELETVQPAQPQGETLAPALEEQPR